jgi:hypothetical protein
MNINTYAASAREKFSDQFAIDYSYLVDKVSGASVDVLSNASVIKDERKQHSVTLTFVHDKTTYGLSYSHSKENDYISNTPSFTLSQDMFGDLTTVTIGFSRSRDEVGENNGTANAPNVTWLGHSESRSYTVGVSQILTRNLISGVTVEIITDDGFLANPYRSVRYLDPNSGKGYSLASQTYPNTRTSTSVEGRLKYYLPYRAAAAVTYRYFRDTWGIVGNTVELGYTQPVGTRWILEGRFRYYKQGHASFYSDLYPYANYQNFEGRDKELAASKNYTIGAKATYAWLPDGWKVITRSTVSADVSRISLKYTDFTDIKDYNDTPAGGSYPPGGEPLYSFTAMVYQVFVSAFF